MGEIENPAVLTCHGWHDCANVPWNQGHILEARAANGFRAVDISEEGEYEIDLRRWPPEATAPIDGVPSDFNEMDYGGQGGGWTAQATSINPETADICVDGVTHTKAVSDNEASVTFQAVLTAGPTRLRAWFDGEKESRGAYYVVVTRL